MHPQNKKFYPKFKFGILAINYFGELRENIGKEQVPRLAVLGSGDTVTHTPSPAAPEQCLIPSAVAPPASTMSSAVELVSLEEGDVSTLRQNKSKDDTAKKPKRLGIGILPFARLKMVIFTYSNILLSESMMNMTHVRVCVQPRTATSTV